MSTDIWVALAIFALLVAALIVGGLIGWHWRGDYDQKMQDWRDRMRAAATRDRPA